MVKTPETQASNTSPAWSHMMHKCHI
uniref:Uncharacterized protein n=1 Tax=Rhizophora mucronata TaxID=61149 RepID=A0A2P2KWQ7_RHIMU